MPSNLEIAAAITARWDELARDTGNREANILGIINTMMESSCRCIYCNALFKLTTPESRDELTNHVMSCGKNPMTEVYEEAKKIIEAHRLEREAREIFPDKKETYRAAKSCMMNIESANGTRVVFANPEYGYPHHQEQCKQYSLVVGNLYTVKATNVGQSSSTVELKEFPGVHFNTVHFANI